MDTNDGFHYVMIEANTGAKHAKWVNFRGLKFMQYVYFFSTLRYFK